MLTTVVEIQSKNAMHLSVQTSVSILVSLRSARSAAKEAHITSQNATQCAIPLPCLAPWSKPLRRYALREEKLTLDKLLSKARSLEASEIQARDIEDSLETSESAKFVKKRTTQKCHQCGYAWPHQNKPCHARRQTCRKYGKTGHFAKVKSLRVKS